MRLRSYQEKMLQEIRPGSLVVGATGCGKSHCIAGWADRWGFLGMLIVGHTEEIIRQISKKLSMPHDIIAPGHPFHGLPVAVASVATLVRRRMDLSRYRFVQFDEGHHVAEGNMWGSIVERTPGAYRIGWTATPVRLDRRSLMWAFPAGLVQGPSVRQLVADGWITPVQVYGPACPIDRGAIPRRADGEFSRASLVGALARSSIVGDVAASYLRFAPGKRGVTFAASVALAHEHAAAYNARGVPAAVVTGETPDRKRYTDALAAGDLLQLVAVGLFGEGYDLPAIEVVTLGKPSESASLIWQQIGRARRPAPDKAIGIVIDHGGNVMRHGLPDYIDQWELDEGRRRSQCDAAPRMRTCPACLNIFAVQGASVCPYCGSAVSDSVEVRTIARRGGDLEAYTAEQLAAMTAQAHNAVRVPKRPPQNMKERIVFNKMRERARAQNDLRAAMAQWGRQCGMQTTDQAAELFRATFGVHYLKAMGLSGPDAEALRVKIQSWPNAD